MAKTEKDPFVGTRIREYEILEIIGKGGMGAVYRGRHIYLDEERAIKVIQSRLAGDKGFIERFIREAKILIKLRHPNLVQIFEFGTLQEDIFFMVLELIRGQSVLQRLRQKKRIPVDESIKIIREAALGLHSAHQKGIVHRDISPDNLLLVKDDSGTEITKVIDFGIAKPLFEGTQIHTVTNMFIGKLEYASPEQCGLLEEGEVIDRRSDIYSLAVTLYQMVSGRLPFYAPTPQGYLLKHASENPKPVSSLLPEGEIPPALDRIILKALSKKREVRQSSMEEFIRELDQVRITDEGKTRTFEGTIEVPVSSLNPGDVFARRYFIEKKIGEGGMGAVYKAVDKILEVPVALKIMSDKVIQSARTLERFKREVILARKVAHPNACRIYDIGESAGIHYVSMEYLEGKTLAEMLQEEGRLTPEVGVPILRQVLLALQEAHRAGVIHRDLKPQNIMVDLNQRTCIMDFGISISSDVHRVTQTGVMIGTPLYMSPEQFEDKNIDHRSDIYSMGVIMFQMFAGRLPFEATSPMAIIFAHLKSQPPKPTEFTPDLPQELEDIILKALEKEPQNRYQNVRELLHALEPLVQSTTQVGPMNREGLAHKYLAERSYSKAVKFLNSMLKTNPGNEEWIKLLNIATSEKAKRDLRRVKSLIHRKNLIQAQLLLEKMQRVHQENTRVISQVRKLEHMLQKQREQTIGAYLAEVENHIEKKDWGAALAGIESAWNLKPNDARIVQLQERVAALQQEDLAEILHARLMEAEALLREGKEDDALSSADRILKENPAYQPAELFYNRIHEARRKREAEQRIKQRLDLALQPMAINNFALAVSMLGTLLGEVAEPDFRPGLEQLYEDLQAAEAAFAKADYCAVSDGLARCEANDAKGWLSPHRKLLQQVREQAEQSDLLQRRFRELFEKGKKFYDEQQWQEATAAWKEALPLNPQDATLQQWIAAAEGRNQDEQRVRSEIALRLKQASAFASRKAFGDANKSLEECNGLLSAEYLLPDLRQQVEALRQNLAEEQEREKKRLRSIEAQLLETTQMFQRGDLQSALQKTQGLLQVEPTQEQALQLRESIQKAIQQREIGENLTRQMAGLVNLLVAEKLKELQAGLATFLTTAKSTPYEKECDLFASELKAIVQSLQENNPGEAARKVRSVVPMIPALKSHEEKLKGFARNLSGLQEKEADFNRLLERTQAAIQARDWNSAVDLMTKAKQIHPDHPEIQKQLPSAAAKLQRYTVLMKEMEKAHKDAEKQVDGEHWDQAISILSKALKQDYSDFVLDEKQGELQGLLKTAEAGRERTKRAADAAAATAAATAAAAAEKIATQQAQVPTPMTKVEQRPADTPTARQLPWKWLAIPLSLVVVGGATWYVKSEKKQELPVSTVSQPASTTPAVPVKPPEIKPQPVPVAPAVASISINALPWARIRFTAAGSGKLPVIPEGESLTPCAFSLPEGDYTIELSNDAGSKITKSVQVRSGTANTFVFNMPAYDPKAIVAQLGKP
jgi:serine/threonine protein kinase